jgi:hypothetical protein
MLYRYTPFLLRIGETHLRNLEKEETIQLKGELNMCEYFIT